MGAYAAAMKNVWEVCIAFCAVAFLLTLLEKEIPMRTTLQSDHGLKEEKKKSDPERVGAPVPVDQGDANEGSTVSSGALGEKTDVTEEK